jgi:hypothetical protein
MAFLKLKTNEANGLISKNLIDINPIIKIVNNPIIYKCIQIIKMRIINATILIIIII